MKRTLRVICIGLLMLAAARPAPARRMPETIVRVGLLVNVPSFNLSCQGPYYLFELSSGTRKDITPMDDTIIRCHDNLIIIEGDMYASPVRLVPGEDGKSIRINGHRYRDSILVMCRNGAITVVNELGFEDYLRGILKMEADPGWPPEALKVQAVISRSYAMRNLRKHGQEGFDVCSRTHCQVYGGMEAEDELCNRAVEDTRGEVLTFNGELAQTLFHASCGGRTENPNDVWKWEQKAPAYLLGVKDPYCGKSPHNGWARTLGRDAIQKRLNNAGYDIGKILSIRISGSTRSGRVRNIVVSHDKGTVTMNAAKFRMAVSPDVIRSTYILRIKKEGGSYRFEGRGWGHGVGLCQWGAREMADRGHDYRKILDHYYPGTVIERWEE